MSKMKTEYCCCLSGSLVSLTQENTGTVQRSLQQHCHESTATRDQAKGKTVQALFHHFHLRRKRQIICSRLSLVVNRSIGIHICIIFY